MEFLGGWQRELANLDVARFFVDHVITRNCGNRNGIAHECFLKFFSFAVNGDLHFCVGRAFEPGHYLFIADGFASSRLAVDGNDAIAAF